MKVSIQDLMERSGVGFGTSGARGLVVAMTDRICYAYTKAFLRYLESIDDLKEPGTGVAVAGDLRPSTGRIVEAVCRAVEDMGYQPVYCGRIPSPAVALYGLTHRIPAVMVTGSHIPDDRNGIKFNKCGGEILKRDEAGIRSREIECPDELFDDTGSFASARRQERPLCEAALEEYATRYREFFAPDSLRGMRVGVYQHSAVGRELLVDVLKSLGAEVKALGFSERFIPVDTEAIRDEDVLLAREWARQFQFDAIVSTDGDSDRPLISDENGAWLRGDVAGILCAKFLDADSISTPVSCNTAVEDCGWFKEVRRTRIGSPYVVASMIEATEAGSERVVGYEANGGFLLNSEIASEGHRLSPLPTRDALILILAILLLSRKRAKSISGLMLELPSRFTASDRLKDFSREKSRAILARFDTGEAARDTQAVQAVFGDDFGPVVRIGRTDGVRITFENGEIVHLRPSGNAPEFRCYTEAASEARAVAVNARCMEILKGLGQVG